MTTTTPPTLIAGTFVIIVRGQDNVADGQICKVLPADAEPNYTAGDQPAGTDLQTYRQGETVLLMCWTGYLVYTEFSNLIPLEVNADARAALNTMFANGARRGDDMVVVF